jgi:hypothetical protein
MRIGRIGVVLTIAASLGAVAFTATPAGANQHIRKYATFTHEYDCRQAMGAYEGSVGCAQFGTPYWILWGPWTGPE